MFSTLKKYGFDKNFIQWIRMMYSKSMDSIRTNDVISKPFILHRGAKQGCPASGLLFNLIIETLAEKIRSERILKA